MPKLALIGTGRWGKNIEHTLQSFSDTELAYTRNEDWKDLLTKTDIEGVLIATPGSTHKEIALAFINKGIPTFIEKPMATTTNDAKEIYETALTNNVPITIGHIHLYNPAYLTAKQEVKKNTQLHYIVFEGTNMGPIRNDMSAIWDWAPHDISMAIDILQTLPTSAKAWGRNILRKHTELYDYAHIELEFDIPVLITNSWLMPEKRKKMMVIGSNNNVTYDDTLPNNKITITQPIQIENEVFTPPDLSQTKHPAYDISATPLEIELRAFLRTITQNKPAQTTAKDGLHVVTIIEAIHESIKTEGKSIKIQY